MQRIQNQKLWNRLQLEKNYMKQNRPAGRDLNEMLLYHTTSASKEVICEEGLDQRLSRKGRFGFGIYFRQAISNTWLYKYTQTLQLFRYSCVFSPSIFWFFPSSIYFSSDDPIKCNHYWNKATPRLMFACYVLLGDIKVWSMHKCCIPGHQVSGFSHWSHSQPKWSTQEWV